MIGGISDHGKAPIMDRGSDGKLTPEHECVRSSSTLFADAATEFLRNYNNKRTFFAYLASTAPRDPRNLPPKYRSTYLRSPAPLPPRFAPQHPFKSSRNQTPGLPAPTRRAPYLHGR